MSIKKQATVINRIGKTAALALSAIAATISMASAQPTAFVISSADSGLVVDVPASSTQPGTTVQQWTANGGFNQQWTLHRYNSTLSYEIVSVNSGLALDVVGASDRPGAKIDQYTAQDKPNQLWNIYRRAGSTQGYEIVSNQMEPVECQGCLTSYENLVLDVPDSSFQPGVLLQQFTENDGLNQQWNFNPEDRPRITLSFTQDGGGIKIQGYHFAPGTWACPVLEDPQGGAAPCTTVAGDGTFSYDLGPQQNGTRLKTGPGYLVVLIEDGVGNVTAIGSVAGSVYQSF